MILNNKIREWINIRSTRSRYLLAVEHQLTWKKENNNCSLKCCHNHSLTSPGKRPGQLCLFQFRLLSGNIFHSFYSRLTPSKTFLSECWCRYKKKEVCFYHPFPYEERQERGNHEPYFYRGGLDLQNRQFFSVFRSNGSKREATAKRGMWQVTTQLKINLILITYQF